jgi:phenylpropionate dioxygenase-like ring-hydroxylating dioxygenase large terminal subunit
MDYLRNIWYVAGWVDELDQTGYIARTIACTPLLIVRGEAGEVAAMRDECPHRFAPLSLGTIGGGRVECGYHGICFDLRGKCVVNPHGPLISALHVKTFPCVARYRAVWVWLGDAEAADPSIIPTLDFVEHSIPTSETHGYEPIAADYQLCSDNILDASHADYLHSDSLGGGSMTRAKSSVTVDGENVRVNWLAENDVAPPALAAALPNPDAPADVWISVDWKAPGVMTLHFGAAPAGRRASESVETANVHVMTPEKPGSTHYFFWTSRNFRTDDAAFNEFLRDIALKAFKQEDKRMLEGQQARLGTASLEDKGPALLRTDAGSTQARRLMRKLIDAEAV